MADGQVASLLGPPLGPMTRFFLVFSCFESSLTVKWGAISDDRMGLQFALQSIFGPGR
jgi:hypothetical protein